MTTALRLPTSRTADAARRTAADATQTLLTRFAVALNRRRAYRPSHPMVVRAEQQLLETITDVMSVREELTLGIGPRELLVDGERLKSRLSVTREIAARLHRRGISSLKFQGGIDREGVRTVLGWLTADSRTAAPTGTTRDVGTGTPTVVGFVIGRIPYDRLVLTDSPEGNEEQVATLWTALGKVALSIEDSVGGDAFSPAVGTEDSSVCKATAMTASIAPNADEIAAAIRAGIGNADYAASVSGMLFTLVDQATHATSRQRAFIGERLRAVLLLLDDQSLSVILTHVGSPEQQRLFLEQVAEALPLNAVVDWLEAAARTNQRTLSHHLLRLLRKLSTLAQGSTSGSVADAGFRDAAHDLVSGWDLDDPDPGEHVELLDQIALIESNRSDVQQDTESPEALLVEKPGESARLVQMALEIDETSLDTEAAVHALMLGGRAVEVLEWIAQAEGSQAAAQLRVITASPDVLIALLLRDSPDIALARAILPNANQAGISTLFDVLAASNVRMIRRLVFDRLREFGRIIWAELPSRLDNATWFFARNLLGLMREIRAAERAAGGNVKSLTLTGVTRYLSHERESLRLEAIRLLLEESSLREGALRRAFSDSSQRVVREALEFLVMLGASIASPAEGITAVSTEFFERVLELIENKLLPEELRARAVVALDAYYSADTCAWLVRHTTQKKFFGRRTVLARSSPTVIAALGLLARRYGKNSRALAVLAMAKATNDLRGHAVTGSVLHASAAGARRE